MSKFDYHIKDIKLASEGKKQIEWARQNMPVLELIRKIFIKEKPLKNLKVLCCNHVTKEMANLCIVLKEAGVKSIMLIASSPLTTQDDVAASLVKDYKIPVFAIKNETLETYSKHIEIGFKYKPDLIIDDGAEFSSRLIYQEPKLASKVTGVSEQTTTGIVRLNAIAKSKALPFPAIGVNESKTKYLYDNRYGTGQSTLDGIIRATNILVAGKTVVIIGYGWCGKGCALRAKGLGGNVIVTETNPIKALEALLDGFRVMPILEAAAIGDVFITVTGNKHVLDIQHFKKMKNMAILCNSGHDNVEINVPGLKKLAIKSQNIRPYLEEYILPNNRSLLLLADGNLVNLVAAEGHPASIMDMSFSNQALGAKFLVENKQKLKNKLYTLSNKIDLEIAKLKLESLGIKIDKLTPQMIAYLKKWNIK